MAPIALLLRTVFEAILEVFLLCLAGYLLARRGIVDKKTQKQLNRLNVSLFTPSLLFSKVAFSLSPAKLRELWIIPLFFVIVTLVSMCVAYFLGWVFRLKRSQRNFAVSASMFMNSNSLPIALMQSLVVTVPGLKWDEDDTESAMLGRALSYLVLYSTLGMVLRWSYGVHLLSQADPEGSDMERQQREVQASEDEQETQPEVYVGFQESNSLLIDIDEADPTTKPTTILNYDRPPSVVFTDADGSPSRDGYGRLHARGHLGSSHAQVFFSFPNTPTRSAVNLPEFSSSSTLVQPYDSDSDTDTDEPLPRPFAQGLQRRRSIIAPTSSRLHSFLRRSLHRVKKVLHTLNEFMTVPLWAAFLSIIVALIPPLQHTLYVHMQPIKGSLTAAGNCSIPLTLVVLGAFFYASPGEEKEDTAMDESMNRDEVVNGNGSTAPSRRDPSRTSGRSLSFVGSVCSMLHLSRLDRFHSKKDENKKDAPRPGEIRTVVIAVAARMVLTPLLLIPLMALGATYDIPKVFDDPVFVVSNVLLISSPPALTLAQITQAASGDAFERLISRTIFWAYCVVTPPATIIYVVIGLLLAKL